jgi:glycosyltransferase involved in cell wall biosynthesis/O-antigen/teichoic acid export membrane protein
VTVSLWSRTRRPLRSIFDDALYRGSLILLANTAVTSAIGFLFWSLAARRYPASAVGVFSSVTSGAGLLAAIAALGLTNVITRHVASVQNARELVVVAVTAIATVGAGLCLVTVLVLGPHLPPALDLQQHGRMVLLITALVIFTAVSNVLDAGLIATRSSHAVLIKNVGGSIVRVAAMILLISFPSSGLLIAYSLGLLVTTVLGSISLGRRIGGKRVRFGSFRILKRYLSITSGNYIASIMGILPSSVVPIEVLVVRGAAQTGRFAVAFLIAGFLYIIPATVARVLFAEASRQGAPLRGQLRKAVRGIYGLLLPASVIVFVTAPLLLRIFGAGYALTATGCLRVLAMSALPMGGTYLVDSLLIARDRITAFVFINGANAALVLGLVGLTLPRGLTAAAGGWALAQSLSLLLGVTMLALDKSRRHRHESVHSKISKLRIIQTPAHFFPAYGGVEIHVLELSKQLVAQGNDVTVVCANEPPGENCSVDGVKTIRLPYITKIANTNITIGLFAALMRLDFETIHTHIPSPWSADISAIASLLKRKPLIVTYHNDLAGQGVASLIARLYSYTFLHLVLLRAKKIIITQPKYLEYSRHLKLHKKKVITVPTGVTAPLAIDKDASVDDHISFIGILDKYHEYKGLDILLNALIKVKERRPNVRLSVGGRGELVSKYEQLAKALGVSNSVEFLGYLSDRELAELYSSSSVFVLPSLNNLEGFGTVALEALSYATPVITTHLAGSSEFITRNKAGLIVPPGDATALAKAILTLLENREEARLMGTRGAAAVNHDFSWDNIARRMVRIYRDS